MPVPFGIRTGELRSGPPPLGMMVVFVAMRTLIGS
jgi:hypothetical protein